MYTERNDWKVDREYEMIQKYLVKVRRNLHQIPELGTHLPKTQKYVCEELKKMGIPYWCSEKDSGIIAEIRGRYEGKTVALRLYGAAAASGAKCGFLSVKA